MRAFVILLLASCATPTADHPKDHAHHHRFEKADEWAKMFDAPDRDAWQKPDDVIRALALEKTDVVADIGAGTGYFSVRIAPHVARVIAADVEPDMVRYVEERAKKENITNIISRHVPPDAPDVGEPVDIALIVNTVHHIEGRSAYFKKVNLREGGVVVVVDFKMGDIPIGPAEPMRVAPAKLIEEMNAAGLALLVLDESTLPYQYIASFTRSSP